MSLDEDRAGILDRLSPESQRALLGQELRRLGTELERIASSLLELQQELSSGQEFFCRTMTLDPATAGTRVHLLSESDVRLGRKAYPIGMLIALEGATAPSGGTATELSIVDSGTDLVYRFCTIEATALVVGNLVTELSDGVSLDDEFALFLGSRVGKGIDIFADGNFASGSPIRVTLYGYIA